MKNVARHKNVWYNACHICRVGTILKFAQQFSRAGRSLENGDKVWKKDTQSWIFFFKLQQVLYKWNKFRFRQIILNDNLAHTVAAHHEKSFDPVFLKSLLITYLISLSLEKRMTKIVLAKKVWKKSRMLYAKICVNPAFDLKAFFKIYDKWKISNVNLSHHHKFSSLSKQM